MSDETDFQNEVDKLIQDILKSPSPRKLIVAGPGTGKTAFFKEAINHTGGAEDDFLVLTFINNLEDELKKGLEGLARVYTFHGYCLYLLIRDLGLGYGLRDKFHYYPPLIDIVKRDWEIIKKSQAPKFIDLMRSLNDPEATLFFIKRGNYYNSVSFDDSIYRVYKSIENGKTLKRKYKMIIVDEYQDFNLLETSTLSQLIKFSPVLIAGDDDQALYCDLRGSDPEYIRKLFGSKNFDKFELPFCFRCPTPVVSIFNHFVTIAKLRGFLKNRIEKKFNPSPTKRKDSETYPTIKLVLTSTQKKSPEVNYFGRYILQGINKIPAEEIVESHDKDFPTILIIGPTHFLNTIAFFFDNEGIQYMLKKRGEEMKINLEDGLKMLKEDKESSLGWRIILEASQPKFYNEAIKSLVEDERKPSDILPDNFIQEFIKKSEDFEIQEQSSKQEKVNKTKPSIKLTTFEGAKGLSAQHVFVLGLQNGILPKNPQSIRDIDLCKFLVAITRSRKQCHILTTYRFAGKPMQVSEFVKWLLQGNIPELEKIDLNKDYWIKNETF